MKNNSKNITGAQKFQLALQALLAQYYADAISENVKRALRKRKATKKASCNVKQCKV
jgi:hypothetical protein